MKKGCYLIAAAIITVLLALGFFVLSQGKIVFNLEDNQQYSFEYGQDVTLPEVKAEYQQVFGLLTRPIENITKSGEITGETGEYEIVWTAETHGKKKDLRMKVSIVDTTPPEIAVYGAGELEVELGKIYEDEGCYAQDIHDGNITAQVVVSGNVDYTKEGTYEIVYSVTDSSGNQAKAVRKITVKKDKSASNKKGGVVYLTFDDGPSALTGKLLKILDKYNVKVTFFVTGNREEYRKYIKEASEKGHTIALHSYTHNYSKCYSSLEDYWIDLNKLNDMVYELTGKRATLVRLPGGSSNTVSKKYCIGVMKQICSSLTENGYRYTDWNVSSGDAGGTEDPAKIAENVIRGMKNHKTAIVLQHDTKGYSIEAVERIIVWGLANGYTFKAMTDGSPVVHHSIRN